ncbi:hypothetical protein AB4P93_22725 [Pseudomonas sp. B26140]|uniref:hypothetical protein n=1 Tax=Pseudomonas sp. B26140 TaxID=3235112 RepID=UPI003783F67C
MAVIAAAVSVGAMLFSFFTAGKSKSILIAVEDRAKRSELVRIQALKSIEEILSGLTDIYFSLGNINFLIEAERQFEPNNEFLELMTKISDARGKLHRIRYVSAPYLRYELTDEVDTILAQTQSVDFTNLKALEQRVLTCMSDISAHAKLTYLFST